MDFKVKGGGGGKKGGEREKGKHRSVVPLHVPSLGSELQTRRIRMWL